MSDRILSSGNPVPDDDSHKELKPNGQQKDYVVLSPAERAKGFVNPVRDSYRHTKCGTTTRMADSIAETYAREPWFYSGTFCLGCGTHLPLQEFTWLPDGEPMDPKLWPPAVVERVSKAKAERRASQSAKGTEL